MPLPLTATQLKARRARLDLRMADIAAEADPETGELSDDQVAALANVKAALLALETLLTRAEADEAQERRGTATAIGEVRATVRVGGRDTPMPTAFDGRVLTTQAGERVPVLEARHTLASFGPVEQRSEISLGGFLRALYFGPANDLERRALAEASIGTGGALVPTPLSLQVLDLLRSRCVAFQAGAVVVPMESQTLRFARQIADPVGGWRAEAAPILEGTPSFDSVTLTAKSWALLVRISRELMKDGQNVDAVLQNIFARTAALALDRAILYGDGTANSPLGVANMPGIAQLSPHFA